MSDKVPGHVETPWGFTRVDGETLVGTFEIHSPHQFPYSERLPSVAQAAQALLPYLRVWGDSGYLGLSERDRDDANNAKCDLVIALERMLR